MQKTFPETPSIQTVPTLASKAYTCYLLWAICCLRVSPSATSVSEAFLLQGPFPCELLGKARSEQQSLKQNLTAFHQNRKPYTRNLSSAATPTASIRSICTQNGKKGYHRRDRSATLYFVKTYQSATDSLMHALTLPLTPSASMTYNMLHLYWNLPAHLCLAFRSWIHLPPTPMP